MRSDPRFERLPKWAQDRIKHEERKVGELQEVIDQMNGHDLREPIAVRDPYGHNIAVAWDRYDGIRFYLMPGDTHQWVEVRRKEDGEIELMASDTLVLGARAANVMNVKVER